MNCETGDLAFYRPLNYPKAWASRPENIDPRGFGRIVGAVRYLPRALLGTSPALMFSDVWEIEPPFPNGATLVPDEWLRPIRDPGDDAVDQTLEWLPVPTRTPETA